MGFTKTDQFSYPLPPHLQKRTINMFLQIIESTSTLQISRHFPKILKNSFGVGVINVWSLRYSLFPYGRYKCIFPKVLFISVWPV